MIVIEIVNYFLSFSPLFFFSWDVSQFTWFFVLFVYRVLIVGLGGHSIGVIMIHGQFGVRSFPGCYSGIPTGYKMWPKREVWC